MTVTASPPNRNTFNLRPNTPPSNGFVQLPGTHPAICSHLSLLNRTGGENKIKKLMSQVKDKEIIYQLLWQAKQI